MTPQEALKKAISLVGGEAELARAINVTPQAINQWQITPPLRVLEIERLSAGRVTRSQLRPDLYPEDKAA